LVWSNYLLCLALLFINCNCLAIVAMPKRLQWQVWQVYSEPQVIRASSWFDRSVSR